MDFNKILSSYPLILSECAIAERLRRQPDIKLHPQLFNTPLIREEVAKKKLSSIYLEYRGIAAGGRLPVLLCAPTWRVDQIRLQESGFHESLLFDAIEFMLNLRKRHQLESSPFLVGALIAPRNDCYSAAQALTREESRSYHRWQLERMASTDIDVIIAQTFPAITEATGIADVMSELGRPYVISFVIDRHGFLLDGTPLAEAIIRIDDSVTLPPAAYMVNCVYPTFICPQKQPAALFSRLLGIQANASSKDHTQLDGSAELQQDPLSDWGLHMLNLNRLYGMKILGGCCGTNGDYLKYLLNH